ncbi:MAG: hypothetical protein JSV36_00625 [Anaerolineae bacterium]|nr:MAG: hypothetical protein JSV36_00625 [Anaerolineae bacterium]
MKHTTLIVGSVVVLVLLLASAAFVGARMLSGQNQRNEGSNSNSSISDSGGTKEFELVPAAELPTASFDINGLFLRREDNSIIVGTGQVRVTMQGGRVAGTHNGPEAEVVVTHDTLVYCDKTEYGTDVIVDGKLQQVVKPGSLEEIEKYSFTFAWGEKRGDRLFATVLLYKIP